MLKCRLAVAGTFFAAWAAVLVSAAQSPSRDGGHHRKRGLQKTIWGVQPDFEVPIIPRPSEKKTSKSASNLGIVDKRLGFDEDARLPVVGKETELANSVAAITGNLSKAGKSEAKETKHEARAKEQEQLKHDASSDAREDAGKAEEKDRKARQEEVLGNEVQQQGQQDQEQKRAEEVAKEVGQQEKKEQDVTKEQEQDVTKEQESSAENEGEMEQNGHVAKEVGQQEKKELEVKNEQHSTADNGAEVEQNVHKDQQEGSTQKKQEEQDEEQDQDGRSDKEEAKGGDGKEEAKGEDAEKEEQENAEYGDEAETEEPRRHNDKDEKEAPLKEAATKVENASLLQTAWDRAHGAAAAFWHAMKGSHLAAAHTEVAGGSPPEAPPLEAPAGWEDGLGAPPAYLLDSGNRLASSAASAIEQWYNEDYDD